MSGGGDCEAENRHERGNQYGFIRADNNNNGSNVDIVSLLPIKSKG